MEIFSAFLALWGRGSPYSASLAPFLPPFPTGGISSTALSAFFTPTHFLQTKQGAGAPCRAPAPSFFGDALLNVGAPLPRVPTKFREHVSPLLPFFRERTPILQTIRKNGRRRAGRETLSARRLKYLFFFQIIAFCPHRSGWRRRCLCPARSPPKAASPRGGTAF